MLFLSIRSVHHPLRVNLRPLSRTKTRVGSFYPLRWSLRRVARRIQNSICVYLASSLFLESPFTQVPDCIIALRYSEIANTGILHGFTLYQNLSRSRYNKSKFSGPLKARTNSSNGRISRSETATLLRESFSTDSHSMTLESWRHIISATLILAECHLCLLRKYRGLHKSAARTIVRHRVAHYALLADPGSSARTRGPDYPIGTGFPFVDRHSWVFSRRILSLSLPLCVSSSRSRPMLAHRPTPSFACGPLGTKGLAEERPEAGRAIHEGTKTTKWRSKEVKK